MSEIRKFIPVPSEYKQAVAVETANFPDEEISIETWKWHDQHFDPNTIFSRWVGEKDRMIISHGLFTQKPDSQSSNNNAFTLHIAVHPDHQQKGHGSELYQHLYRHLQQYMPCTIETVVREDKPQSVYFLEHRQFKAKAKQHVARLKIPANSTPLDINAYTNHLASLGIRIAPLSTVMEEDH
jgi:ribosomal protein S18 acetylase RimI-like enzyme